MEGLSVLAVWSDAIVFAWLDVKDILNCVVWFEVVEESRIYPTLYKLVSSFFATSNLFSASLIDWIGVNRMFSKTSFCLEDLILLLVVLLERLSDNKDLIESVNMDDGSVVFVEEGFSKSKVGNLLILTSRLAFPGSTEIKRFIRNDTKVGYQVIHTKT